MPEALQIRNRIVGYEDVDPSQLLANPNNWRVHPRFQQEALEGILEDVGWVQTIIVNRTTGHVIDGHLRVMLAMRKGLLTVPVGYIEVSEAEELIILGALDAITAMAGTDKTLYASLIDRVTSTNPKVNQLYAALAKQHKLNPELPEPAAQVPSPSPFLSDVTAATDVLGPPMYEPEQYDVWQCGKSILSVAEVITGCEHWAKYLKDRAFVPYAGPWVLHENVDSMLMVQPSRFLAGHILDRSERAFGVAPTLIGAEAR